MGHSGRLHSITVWQTIISRLRVQKIISFRKTKCVKFTPRATNYFCPLKKERLDCDNILEELCLLIFSRAFYLRLIASGWFGVVSPNFTKNLFNNTDGQKKEEIDIWKCAAARNNITYFTYLNGKTLFYCLLSQLKKRKNI